MNNENISERKLSTEPVVLVHSRYIQIELQAGLLNVVHIDSELVSKCAWWLLRQYSVRPQSGRSPLFTSLIMDEGGASLACTPLATETLKSLISPEKCTISPQYWRAVIINISDSAFEYPGTVYFLANVLSDEGLSILHISTFESEVFLIQEMNVERACSILQNVDKGGRLEKFLNNPLQQDDLIHGEQGSEYLDDSSSIGESSTSRSETDQISQPRSTVGSEATTSTAGVRKHTEGASNGLETPLTGSARLNDEEEAIDLDVSWITPSLVLPTARDHKSAAHAAKASITSPTIPVVFQDGFHLCVLPNYVRLAKLADGFDVSDFASTLTKILLFDERFNLCERKYQQLMKSERSRVDSESGEKAEGLSSDTQQHTVATTAEASSDSLQPFMWGMWRFDNEMTFLLQESDLSLFPKSAFVVSPQRWRIIKLAGRAIGFDECGVVSAMSKIENIPTLNISTATTNCALVPHELLEPTVSSLSAALKCPIQRC